MEEMTIQEKARRYDESIERARKLKENPKAIFFEEKNVHVSDYIFPELQKNRDERIREAIYNCVEWFDSGLSFFRYVPKEECLAWLGKQSEQKPTDNEMKELLRTEYEKERADALAEVYCQKPERNPNLKEETLTKLIEEIDRLDEERKQNTKYKSAKSGFAHTVRYFFLSNEIKTLGELLSLGRKHVARCRNIGKMTMWAIDKALENLYGITEW